jgi:type II secretory pathway pseudopilin PulG
MKRAKAFTILEFVLVLSILSIITISISQYILSTNHFYKSSKNNLTNELSLQNCLQSISNLLEKSIINTIEQTDNNYTFYTKIDGFQQFVNNQWQSYSHYCDLNSSSKEYLFSPNSNFELLNLENKRIYSNNKTFDIKTYTQNRLYFEDNSTKTISEYFDIVEKNNIYLSNNNLYLNNTILHKNISKFEISQNLNNITINICTTKNKCKKGLL